MIRNLIVLNVAEVFERFTFYGIRSIFILFLTKALHLDKVDAVEIFGTFTMVVYLASVLGGILGDLTKKPALIAMIGNSLTTAGAFLMAFAGNSAMVYAATVAVAIGSGIFKPSIISTLFRVSFTHKHRFDLVFMIFY